MYPEKKLKVCNPLVYKALRYFLLAFSGHYWVMGMKPFRRRVGWRM